jgi:FKBP-type peptidyl-prolyl cis-trans isomerase
MDSGIEISEVEVGAGQIAEENARVVIHARGMLNRGEVFLDTLHHKTPMHIELKKRVCIAGLRYGIVGMRVGGRRKIVVSPHLGYGAEGLQGKIPPNAVLRFDVELLEVRKSGEVKPEDFPHGKHLYFFWPGEANRKQPRIQFGLEEDGRCGVGLTIPQPGLTWRYAKNKSA